MFYNKMYISFNNAHRPESFGSKNDTIPLTGALSFARNLRCQKPLFSPQSRPVTTSIRQQHIPHYLDQTAANYGFGFLALKDKEALCTPYDCNSNSKSDNEPCLGNGYLRL
ncbi:hypothetical protein LENED_007747 [Lentinula edodes]|uniref:Uncharacterized protein n=1 Tax=Lentinula edodes TaxID=5353 RepID=A0A1Q3EF76_LENED|nr:hypothetical protein LENED_007747 [Lentinula edodes]